MPHDRKPRGIRNHNPGNIERRPGVFWEGMADDQTSDTRFVVFTEPKYGIRAIARVLIRYADTRAANGTPIDTVREIVERWAPAAENNVEAYAESLAALFGGDPHKVLEMKRWDVMRKLVRGIIWHENGSIPYDDATIDAGLLMAGIKRPSRISASVKAAAGAVTGAAVTAAATVPDLVNAVITSAGTAKAVTAATEGVTGKEVALALGVVVLIASSIALWLLAFRNQRLLGGAAQ